MKFEFLIRVIEIIELVSYVDLFLKYVLILDNIFKMVFILFCIRVNIFVIIMGEIGCGKISFVRYFVKICDVFFYVFNFYVGVIEIWIINFVEEIKKEVLCLERRK